MLLFNYRTRSDNMSKMDESAINSIKILALDMINKAGSGHPGMF